MMRSNIQTQSTITCPDCRHQSAEEMPVDSCRFFWNCPRCEATIKPRPGDCCVFCSYGDVSCPPVQQNGTCDL